MNHQKEAKIRVLIVDDSAGMRMMLEWIFGHDPAFEVAGVASDGIEAVDAVARLSPDVITMDIQMPRMDGLEATRKIMETKATPIIILSGNLDAEEVASSFRAMEAGALVAMAKPRSIAHPEHEADVANLVRIVKLMAEIKMVKHRPRVAKGELQPLSRLPASRHRPTTRWWQSVPRPEDRWQSTQSCPDCRLVFRSRC